MRITQFTLGRYIHYRWVRRAALIALVCLPAIHGFLAAQQPAPYRMPGWFWISPDSKDGSLSVGFAPRYYTIQSSYDEAYLDAAWRLFIDRESRVHGGQATTNVATGVFHAGKVYKFDVDSTLFEGFTKSLVRIDSAATKDLIVMLVGRKKIEVDRIHVLPPPELNPGEFRVQGSIVTLAGSPQYHQEDSSWKEAERNARIEAALALNAKIRSVEGHLADQSIKTVIVETDVRIRNLQTVARTINASTGEHIVIVRVKR